MNPKKLLISFISIIGVANELYEFYKRNENELKTIVDPLIDLFGNTMDIDDVN